MRTLASLVAVSTLTFLVVPPVSVTGQGRSLSFSVNPGAADLQCPTSPAAAQPAPAPATPAEDPEVIPTVEDLGEIATRPPVPRPTVDKELVSGFALRTNAAGMLPLRVGVWGDSHMASGVFSGELTRLIGARGGEVETSYLPPTMGRSGVRLAIRKYCQGTTWKLEPAYTSARTAQTGPSLVSLRSTRRGAYLWIDFRVDARPSRVTRVRIMYLPTNTVSSIGIKVDEGAEQKVVLSKTSATGDGLRTADVDIATTGAPLSTVKLRVIEGVLALQGFRLTHSEPRAVTMDVFGLPSATMRGWLQVDTAYLKDALRDTSYDAVILQYGTNEGNATDFDKDRYAAGLAAALENLRAVFPDAACLLIGPTDRGIRIRKPSASRARRTAKPQAPPDLLKYARVHQEITAVQAEVGRRYQCASWDWQAFMGGPGGSYLWALSTPPLAAKDLTHLTPSGYRQSAAALARAIGWDTGEP